MLKLVYGKGWKSGKDTLLPLTTGCSLAVQFWSYGDLPAVIHIGRKVPKAGLQNEELLVRYLTLGAVVLLRC